MNQTLNDLEPVGQRGWKPLKLAGAFLRPALLLVPLYGMAGSLGLWSAAVVFSRWYPAMGGWGVFGDWTLRLSYGVVGFFLGVCFGLLCAGIRGVATTEQTLMQWLQEAELSYLFSSVPTLSLSRLQDSYQQVTEQIFNQTVGRLPLPGVLRRFFQRRLRQELVDDFLEFCQRRGSDTVGAREFKDWFLEKGLPLVMTPPSLQLQLWRWVVVGAFLLLGVAPFAIVLLWK
ncbi:MAG: hypothetical protein AB1898_27250 [Acidobacteriota bacterium]